MHTCFHYFQGHCGLGTLGVACFQVEAIEVVGVAVNSAVFECWESVTAVSLYRFERFEDMVLSKPGARRYKPHLSKKQKMNRWSPSGSSRVVAWYSSVAKLRWEREIEPRQADDRLDRRLSFRASRLR